jgi:hypothetical protein
MGAGPDIKAGKRFVEEQQSRGTAKCTRQLEALGFAVGQGKNSAVEEWLEAEVLDEPLLKKIELRTSSLSFGARSHGGNLKRIEAEDTFVGKEAAHGTTRIFFEAIPSGLDNGVVELRTTVFESNVGNGLFSGQAAWRTEMIAQVSTHEG